MYLLDWFYFIGKPREEKIVFEPGLIASKVKENVLPTPTVLLTLIDCP